jgi:Fic family protein
MFEPHYHITPAITKALMAIEADRQAIAALPVDVEMLASLRESARLLSTHYSTQIEGNRLTQAQVQDALAGATFPGRQRDEVEVRHYYRAIEEVERLGKSAEPLSELAVKRIHGLVMTGHNKPTPYRDGQNVIRDSRSGAIVYMPPEAKDVPALIRQLITWIKRQRTHGELPVPLVAAIAHYQFATIHPYYDGNGRTARLLTTLILHKGGYGLKGIYSLEEYYAKHLSKYYAALNIGPSHNYYLGRAEADITGFLAYFCDGMAEAFSAVRAQAAQAQTRGAKDQSDRLRQLDPRERKLLALFAKQSAATTDEMARHLGLSHRTLLELCRRWVRDGFLEMKDASRKRRRYGLGGGFDDLLAK